eukprot:TRINITY_DN21987_c0_g2_i1.p1 TRINITY_DN21987_c0_g2~~TRINITY_DN21987_c0_g2_i1.p1  ORF type:complete len:583 (-),score=100.56 TRINITY_DN21987_c0_g2_i1:142-1890(-)
MSYHVLAIFFAALLHGVADKASSELVARFADDEVCLGQALDEDSDGRVSLLQTTRRAQQVIRSSRRSKASSATDVGTAGVAVAPSASNATAQSLDAPASRVQPEAGAEAEAPVALGPGGAKVLAALVARLPGYLGEPVNGVLLIYVGAVMAISSGIGMLSARQNRPAALQHDVGRKADSPALNASALERESLPLTALHYRLALAWAFSVGVSVTFHAKAFVMLNRRSHHPLLHSVSVLLMQSVLVCIPLSLVVILLACFGVHKSSRPPVWCCLGGVCSILSFAAIVASAAFGLATTMTALLSGSLGSALLIDFVQSKTFSLLRVAGVLAVILSARLLLPSETHVVNGRRYVDFLCLFLTMCSGACFALQAVCNGKLRSSLGSPFHAALVCNIVIVCIWTPLWMGCGVPLQPNPGDVLIWLFCVAQNMYCFSSMAVLPSMLSFATTFMASVCGQLLTAVAIDLYGAAARPSTQELAAKCAGLLLALSGAAACSARSARRCETTETTGAGEGGGAGAAARSTTVGRRGAAAPLAVLEELLAKCAGRLFALGGARGCSRSLRREAGADDRERLANSGQKEGTGTA